MFLAFSLLSVTLLVPRVDVEEQVAALREAGIYPPPGAGTYADVENVFRAGHKILAVRLYREIHGVRLAAAVEAIKRLS